MNRRIHLIVVAVLTLLLCAALSFPAMAQAGLPTPTDGAPASIAARALGNAGIEECLAAANAVRGVTEISPLTKIVAYDYAAATTLAADTTYTGDVWVEKGAAVDLNGFTLQINGNLYVYGTLNVNGTLKVSGSVTVVGGVLQMTSAAGTAAMGSFFDYGADHTGKLTAGTLTINGDFLQYNNYSAKSFCPAGTKVVLKGSNRLVYFDSPGQSWIGSYDFSGATFNASSLFSLKLGLSADLSLASFSHLCIQGALNGKTLTVPANTIVVGPLTLGGGRLTVGGALLVDHDGSLNMTSATDIITVAGNFTTGGTGTYSAGTVEINGNFTQYGAASGFHDNAYVGQPAHKTKIIGTGRKIRFDSPVTSCFGQLDTSAATWTADSVVSLNCDLTADTTWTYPVVYYGGRLAGHDLTVAGDLYARQITPGGGTLTAEKDFMAAAANCLVMTNPLDSVIVKGNFLTTYSMDPASITAGTLELSGNFTQAGSDTSFLASGAHKTILAGANKTVMFTDPGKSWFNQVQIAGGASLASGSVLSIKGTPAADLSLNVRTLYYSGTLAGHDLEVAGDLHLFGTVNPGGATIKASGDVTLDGTLAMSDAADRLEVGGAFTGSGSAALTAGTAEFKKSFRYTGTAYTASGTHATTLSGGAGMAVIFDHPAQSWFASLTLVPGTTLSTSSVLSLKTAGQANMTLTVSQLYLQGALGGKAVSLTGSLTVPAGASLTIGGGSLNVSGGMALDGALVMTNAADWVNVGGSFTARGPDETGKLTAGKLVVKGNFTQLSTVSAKSFVGTAGHGTILSGAGAHVSFATPNATTGSAFGTLYRIPGIVFDTQYYYANEIITSANLKSLTGTGGTLVPAFSPAVTSYRYVLPKGVTSTTISADSEYRTASTMLMNGVVVTPPAALAVTGVPYSGSQTVTITVKAQDDADIKTYTVKVEQLNLDLKSLNLSAGTLDQTFDPALTSYTATLPASAASVTITPVADHPDTTVSIDGVAAANKQVSLKPGESATVRITLTGQNGTSTRTYTLDLTRDEILTGIAASAGVFAQEYSSPVANYTLDLTALEDTVTLTPAKAPGCTGLTIDGVARSSASYTLALGSTKQAVIVATAGSASFTYTVTIARAPIISDFGLSAPTGAVLSPAFNPEGGNFTLTVPASTTTLTLTPPGAQCTKLTINGAVRDWITLDQYVNKNLPVGGSVELTFVAQAGTGGGAITRTFHLTVVKKAIISALAVSQGALTPAFNPTVMNYTVELPATSAGLSVTPTKLSGSVAINGQAWDAAQPQVLNPAPGASADALVKCDDGAASVTYKVTARRQKPISGITLSSGALSPTFNASTQTYTVTVPASTTSVAVTPVKTADCTALIINGNAVSGVALSPAIGGTATAEIRATGPDGTTVTTYKVNVVRQALLAGIKVSTGALSPAFQGSTTAYAVYLPNATTAVTITPTKSASCASFTIDGKTATSVTLKPAAGGSAKTTIRAVTSSGFVQTYTVTAYRICPITAIKLSTGTLSPAFSKDKTAYSVSIPVTTKSVTITPTRGSSCAALSIDGKSVSSVTLYPQVGGKLTATIRATAVGGQVFTYTVSVTRAPLLKGISLSTGSLSPAFSATVFDYTVNVPATTASVKVTPSKATKGVKKMTINGKSAKYVTLAPPAGGSAKATIVLTASDGKTKQTYTVTVKRAALLTGLTTSAGSLSPAFSAATTAYTVSLPADTASTILTVAKASSGVKSVTMNGAAVTSLTVAPPAGGTKVVAIVATASNGKTKISYSVTVKRAPAISGIKVAGGSLSPAFSPTTASYTVSIPATTKKVTLTPAKTSACTYLSIDGIETASRDYAPAVGGSVTATVTAKTALGLTFTYKVKIVRAALVTGIRTSTSSNGISPAFSATTYNYTVNIPKSRTSITIYATKAAKGVKAMTMNGRSARSLVVKPAAGKSVTVTIVATASDGVTKVTYIVTVKRAN